MTLAMNQPSGSKTFAYVGQTGCADYAAEVPEELGKEFLKKTQVHQMEMIVHHPLSASTLSISDFRKLAMTFLTLQI